jgi:hypothetical protein
MARTQINWTEPTRAGVAFPVGTAADTVNGNYVTNDNRVVIVCSNSSGSTVRNVTVALTGTVDGQGATSRTIPIPVSSSVIIGPYDTGNYGTQLALNGDSATDVKFQPIHFPG